MAYLMIFIASKQNQVTARLIENDNRVVKINFMWPYQLFVCSTLKQASC